MLGCIAKLVITNKKIQSNVAITPDMKILRIILYFGYLLQGVVKNLKF
jgi:hypothetical protein